MKAKILFTTLILLLSSLKLNAQCAIVVSDAIQLRDALYNAPTTTTPYVICVSGNIDLGDLDACEFPLELKPYVVIQGYFDLFSTLITRKKISEITCPYLFRYNGSGGITIFLMKEHSAFQNIRLVGPKNDLRDWRYLPYDFNSDNSPACNNHNSFTPLSELEGTVTGLQIDGEDCVVQDCEIFGFPRAGIQVYDSHEDQATMQRNYIHNNKGLGFGYGIWVGGAGNNICEYVTDACGNSHVPTQPDKYFNSTNLDEPANISNSVFFDNKHDVAGSPRRNSYNITNCTFSQRSGHFNIDRHAEGLACNFWGNATPCIPNNAHCYNQYQVDTIYEVGGNETSVINSVFYKEGANLGISYPNTNVLTPGLCGGPNTNTTEGLIQIKDCYFDSPYNTTGGRITIAQVPDHTLWNTGDTHLSFPGNNFISKSDFNNPPIGVPAAVPTVNVVANGVSNGELVTTIGDLISFSTANCFDAAGGQNNTMCFLWRLHEQPNDLTDELRTSWGTFKHTFSNIGINRVTLMSIDQTNFRASDLNAGVRIITAPVPSPVDPQPVYLVVNWKDTYTGRLLQSSPTTCGSYLPDNASDFSNVTQNTAGLDIDLTPTGFEKYIQINGTDIHVEDIAGDDGWERMEFEISHLLTSIDCDTCNDNIEVGIRTAANAVDPAMVRGFNFFVDDIYISGPDHGRNLISNGDFEDTCHTASSTNLICDWSVFDHGIITLGTACPNSIPLNVGSLHPSLFEPRSGLRSYMGEIRKLTNGYDPGSIAFYPANIKYKSIKQDFNWNITPPRLEDPSFAVPAVKINIQPNPSSKGSEITFNISGDYNTNQQHSLNIFSSNGMELYRTNYFQNSFNLKLDLRPGVYFAKISYGSQTKFEKIIIL